MGSSVALAVAYMHPGVRIILMQMKVIVLVLSCAASSLTLTAPSSMPAPPQAQEQRAVDTKENSSGAEVNKVTPAKKIVSDPEAEPFESSQRSFEGLGNRFLEDQKQIWTSPARLRFSDTDLLWATRRYRPGCFARGRRLRQGLSPRPSS